MGRAGGFFRQDVDHGGLKAGGEIGQRQFFAALRRRGLVGVYPEITDLVKDGGLEAAEGEVPGVGLQARAGEFETGGITLERLALDEWPAGEAEAQHARYFVERFA